MLNAPQPQSKEIISLVYENLEESEDKYNFSCVSRLFNEVHWLQNCKKTFGITPSTNAKEIFRALLAIDKPEKYSNTPNKSDVYNRISETLSEYSRTYPKEPWVFYYLSKLYWFINWEGQNFDQAKQYCIRATELKHKEALGLQAIIYRDGMVGFPRDQQKSLEYFALGGEPAKRELGLSYLEGKGCIKKDLTKAIPLLEPIANNGDNAIALKLGLALIKSDLAQTKQEEAISYLKLAAERKPPDSIIASKAAYTLGCIFTDGRNTILKDDEQAKKYLRLASKFGNIESRKVLRLQYHIDLDAEFEQQAKNLSKSTGDIKACYIM